MFFLDESSDFFDRVLHINSSPPVRVFGRFDNPQLLLLLSFFVALSEPVPFAIVDIFYMES